MIRRNPRYCISPLGEWVRPHTGQRGQKLSSQTRKYFRREQEIMISDKPAELFSMRAMRHRTNEATRFWPIKATTRLRKLTKRRSSRFSSVCAPHTKLEQTTQGRDILSRPLGKPDRKKGKLEEWSETHGPSCHAENGSLDLQSVSISRKRSSSPRLRVHHPCGEFPFFGGKRIPLCDGKLHRSGSAFLHMTECLEWGFDNTLCRSGICLLYHCSLYFNNYVRFLWCVVIVFMDPKRRRDSEFLCSFFLGSKTLSYFVSLFSTSSRDVLRCLLSLTSRDRNVRNMGHFQLRMDLSRYFVRSVELESSWG